jgi:hypothetical protein
MRIIKTFVAIPILERFHKLAGVAQSEAIVSDYGLDDLAIGVRYPTEAVEFSSSHCVQTGSEAPYPVGPASPFLGGKALPGHDADLSPPSSA